MWYTEAMYLCNGVSHGPLCYSVSRPPELFILTNAITLGNYQLLNGDIDYDCSWRKHSATDGLCFDDLHNAVVSVNGKSDDDEDGEPHEPVGSVSHEDTMDLEFNTYFHLKDFANRIEYVGLYDVSLSNVRRRFCPFLMLHSLMLIVKHLTNRTPLPAV